MKEIKQLTEEQAIEFYNSNVWKDWDYEQIVKFQLFQDRLSIPFNIFHEAMEKVLNRPIWTHEFAFKQNLIEEYFGKRTKPTMNEIIELIPEEKRILIGI